MALDGTEQKSKASAQLEECLRLLRSDVDEQRVVGLLVATKVVEGNDLISVRRVFDAISFHFLKRLLCSDGTNGGAYRLLAVRILAAFCRCAELAAKEEMIENVPLLLDWLRASSNQGGTEEVLECCTAIGAASQGGWQAVCDASAIPATATRIASSPSGASWLPLAFRLLSSLLGGPTPPTPLHTLALGASVPAVARELRERSDAGKFDAVDLLIAVLTSPPPNLVQLAAPEWTSAVREGLGQILHSHVLPRQRRRSLQLAGLMCNVAKPAWLAGPISAPPGGQPYPPDRFFLLVVESLRVEGPVLVEKFSRLSLSPSPHSTTATAVNTGRVGETEEAGHASEGGVREAEEAMGECLSALEHCIEALAVAAAAEEEGGGSGGGMGGLGNLALQRGVGAVDDVVKVLLEFLQEAKDHGMAESDGVLAAVRLVGRYLAEVSGAHRKKVSKTLGFMLEVKGKGEPIPARSVQFLLPALLQITNDPPGCATLVKRGGHKQIVEFMCNQSRVGVNGVLRGREESHSALRQSCDVMLNVLASREESGYTIDLADVAPLLPAMLAWTSATDRRLEQYEDDSALAVCVLASVLEVGVEEALKLGMDSIGEKRLPRVFSVLAEYLKPKPDWPKEGHRDLWDITVSACTASLPHWPSLARAVEKTEWWAEHTERPRGDERFEQVAVEPLLQTFITCCERALGIDS